jgi:3-oxoadipate enol-lactonase
MNTIAEFRSDFMRISIWRVAMRLARDDRGQGPVVVLLHGFPLDRSMWSEQASALEAGYRLIVPDLRGHGESPLPDGGYSMDEMADDVLETLDSLGIPGPVILGGLSMGGYVALSIVVRQAARVRALMLVDTRAGTDTPEGAKTRQELAARIEAEGTTAHVVDAMVPRLFSSATQRERPEVIAATRRVMERTPAKAIAGTLRGLAARPDRRGDLARIRVPTLVLVGEEDVIAPPAESESMAAAIAGSRLERVQDAGHMAPLEKPGACNAVIRSFLDAIA